MQGFRIAKGSDISPPDLCLAGFTMKDFKFYPSAETTVKTMLKLFTIDNIGSDSQQIFIIKRK
jgi:hypothetical protein